MHDPDFNEYFVIEMVVDNIILLRFSVSLPFLLIFESQTSKTDFLAKNIQILNIEHLSSRRSLAATLPNAVLKNRKN